MTNESFDFQTQLPRLIEQMEAFERNKLAGQVTAADRRDLLEALMEILPHCHSRLRDASQMALLETLAASLRRTVRLDEILYRQEVLLALALRRQLMSDDALFEMLREVFRARETMPPEERADAELILGRDSSLLGEGYHNVEADEADLAAHLEKMHDAWAERAEAAFARRVHTADESVLAAWEAEVQTELDRLNSITPDAC